MERVWSNFRIRSGFLSWPTLLIATVLVRAVLPLAVKPHSFLLSFGPISYFLLLLLATGFAIRNGVENTLGTRPFWVSLAIGYGLWALDQWIFLYYEHRLHIDVPDDSMADPLLFLHIVPLMAAVATLSNRNLSGRKLYRAILNALLLLFFCSFLYVYAVFPYQYLFPDGTSYALRFDSLYLLENLVLVALVAVSSFRARPPWKTIYVHLLGASTLYALSSAVANLAIDSGGYISGKLYGAGLVAAACWSVWIPLYARRLQRTEAEEDRSEIIGPGSKASTWAMLLVVMMSIPIVWELFRRDEVAGMRTFRLLVAVASIVCLAGAAYVNEYLAKSELASALGLANDRLRLAVEAGQSVGWEWDLKTGRDSWFGDLQTMFGIPSDSFVGRPEDFHRYVHPEDRQLVAKAVADARQNRKPYAAEFRVVRLDGTVRWVVAKGNFYYGINGDAERMLGMANDITERRHTEQSLRLFRELIDESSDAIEVVHPETLRFLDVNEKCCRDLGYTREELLSRSVYDIDPIVDESLWASRRKQIDESGFALFETVHRRQDGSTFPVEINLKRVQMDRVYFINIVRDITERRRTQEALRESEERLHLAVHAGKMYAFNWDVTSDVIVRSGECTGILNWLDDPTHDTGREFTARVHPDDLAEYTATETGLSPESPTYQTSFRLLRPDGSVVWLEDTGRASFDVQGKMLRMTGLVADITERKRGEDLLRQKEADLSEAQRLAQVGSWQWDSERDTVMWSKELYRIAGLDPALPPPSFKEHPRLYTADSWEWLHRSVQEALRTGAAYELDLEMVRPDGSTRWIRARGEKCRDATGGNIRLRGTAQDITERKWAEESLGNVSRRLIETQEQERGRIARELHDDIGQRLALLAVELEQLHQDPPNSSEVNSRIGELQRQASEIAIDIQTLSHKLHSSKLEYLGIVAAMGGFCKEFGEQQKVEIDFKTQDLPLRPLPPDISLCLFRILQEALNNSAKHSGVRHFTVRLGVTPDEIHLAVSDSGAGFDREVAKESHGLGLISMEERLKLVKGTFSVESQPNRGTTIHARVPLPPASDSLRATG
jgi:PAS domain S-box-containing protein